MTIPIGPQDMTLPGFFIELFTRDPKISKDKKSIDTLCELALVDRSEGFGHEQSSREKIVSRLSAFQILKLQAYGYLYLYDPFDLSNYQLTDIAWDFLRKEHYRNF